VIFNAWRIFEDLGASCVKNEDFADPWASESCEPENSDSDVLQQSSPLSDKEEEVSSSAVDAEQVIKSIADSLLHDKSDRSDEGNSEKTSEVLKHTSLRGMQVVINYYNNVDNSVNVEGGGVAFGTQSVVSNSGAIAARDLSSQTVSSYSDILSAQASVGQADKESQDSRVDVSALSLTARVEYWFESHQDLEQRILMITLAVLNGSNYQVAIAASTRLKCLIYPSSDPEESLASGLVQTTTRRTKRLEEVYAHLEDGYENKEYGQDRIKRVVFDEPGLQSAVLQYIWEEEDTYCNPLLTWIEELGSHPSFEIRVIAAAVAGELSSYTFGTVKDKVFLPWAKSDKPFVQRLAALALSVPAYSERQDISQQALKLVSHWSSLENSPKLRWTAIVAYGTYVGLRFPELALDQMYKAVQSDDGRFFSIVAESVVNLFETSKFISSQNVIVLNALEKWTEPAPKTPTHRLGSLIFTEVMRDSKISVLSSKKQIPTLLFLSTEFQKHEDSVICLLRRVLNLKLTRSVALDEIQRWLTVANGDRSLCKTMGRILFKICRTGDGRERERIGVCLCKWALDEHSCAHEVFSVLKQKELI
jgi:hypothetical protein